MAKKQSSNSEGPSATRRGLLLATGLVSYWWQASSLSAKGLVGLSAFEPEGEGYRVLLEMSGAVGRIESALASHMANPCAQCKLEERVLELGEARAGAVGASRVKISILRVCGEAGKLILAALFGWIAGSQK